MRTSLIFALSTLALIASGGMASAQSCENGYQELGNGVTLKCEAPATASATPDAAEVEDALPAENLSADALPAEPATTGSINAPTDAADPGAVSDSANPDVLEAESVTDCQPGQYYMMESDDATTPMMCR